jgi:hypothetical protein
MLGSSSEDSDESYSSILLLRSGGTGTMVRPDSLNAVRRRRRRCRPRAAFSCISKPARYPHFHGGVRNIREVGCPLLVSSLDRRFHRCGGNRRHDVAYELLETFKQAVCCLRFFHGVLHISCHRTIILAHHRKKQVPRGYMATTYTSSSTCAARITVISGVNCFFGGAVLSEAVNLSSLSSHLWKAANILRGPVDAADFKTYIFPLLFFKRVSDVYDEERESALEGGKRFDIVLLVNGIPAVIGEAKTPVRPAVTWVDGTSDIHNG